MKQSILQTISLILCILLLILVLAQNRQMRQRHEQLEDRIHDLQMMLSDEVRSISSNLEHQLEESQQVIASFNLQPRGISKEENALLTDVSVTLKEWHTDTQVTLLATVGDRQKELPAQSDGNGTFTAQLPIPLETSLEVSLSAKLSGGETHRLETLGAWSGIAMLLPLQNSGGGWDGPTYRDGTMSSNFNISIRFRDGISTTIKNPRFQFYLNGELAETLPAVIDPYSSSSDGVNYTVDSPGYRWHLECDLGDTVDIRFLCEDEYGLGYDFLYANWTASEDRTGTYNGSTYQSGSFALNLYWPE